MRHRSLGSNRSRRHKTLSIHPHHSCVATLRPLSGSDPSGGGVMGSPVWVAPSGTCSQKTSSSIFPFTMYSVPIVRGGRRRLKNLAQLPNDVSALLHLFEDSPTIPGGGGAVFFEASMVFLLLFAVRFPREKREDVIWS